MRLSGTRHVASSPEALWAVLADPERLGTVVPGVEGVEKTGDSGCRATVRTATGLGVTTFDVSIEMVDGVEPEGARIVASGRSGSQRVDASVVLGFARSGDGTDVTWEADVRVAGPLSSMGQQAIGGLIRQHVDGAIARADGM